LEKFGKLGKGGELGFGLIYVDREDEIKAEIRRFSLELAWGKEIGSRGQGNAEDIALGAGGDGVERGYRQIHINHQGLETGKVIYGGRDAFLGQERVEGIGRF